MEREREGKEREGEKGKRDREGEIQERPGGEKR
jgi:hypothetical protein